MQNSAVVTINHLLKQFPVGGDYFTALKDVTLSFAKGEFTGLVGPSGDYPKIFMYEGGPLDPPYDVTAHTLPLLMNVDVDFVYEPFSVNLNKVDEKEREKMVKEAVEWVGLTDKLNSRPAMLSGGECQRTAIARAIVHKPELILADEPTANLDAENSHHIMKIMTGLNRELSTSFIFATHDEKIMAYLRRIIHLPQG